MNDDYLRSMLDYLKMQEDVSKLVRGTHHFNLPNLGITSLARMAVYNYNFGWGRLIFMGPSAIAYEGLAYMLATPVNDGSLNLSVGLRADHMATFAYLNTNI
jgi:shikimate O-hydroxycinnamoyltransferase